MFVLIQWTKNEHQIHIKLFATSPKSNLEQKYTLFCIESHLKVETHFPQKKISENIQKYTFIYP